jgi:hypothetical protein
MSLTGMQRKSTPVIRDVSVVMWRIIAHACAILSRE